MQLNEQFRFKSWERILEGQEDPSTFLDQAGTERQITLVQQWMSRDPNNTYERLHELKMPVLVANGDKDVLSPVLNIWILYQKIPGARLAIYPAAGHGFSNQYASRFAADVKSSLDN